MSPWPAPERDTWHPRPGILSASELQRRLRDHPAWRLDGDRLVRELRFPDRREALRCVERLATEVHDFARHPDICLLDGDRVLVAVANANRVGVTVSELRLVAKVDAVIDGDVRALPRPAAAGAAVAAARGDSHEHALGA